MDPQAVVAAVVVERGGDADEPLAGPQLEVLTAYEGLTVSFG